MLKDTTKRKHKCSLTKGNYTETHIVKCFFLSRDGFWTHSDVEVYCNSKSAHERVQRYIRAIFIANGWTDSQFEIKSVIYV